MEASFETEQDGKNEGKEAGYAFQLRTPERIYFLKTDLEEDVERWRQAIADMVHKIQSQEVNCM